LNLYLRINNRKCKTLPPFILNSISLKITQWMCILPNTGATQHHLFLGVTLALIADLATMTISSSSHLCIQITRGSRETKAIIMGLIMILMVT
jgi:hypothetical protein